MRPKRLPLVIVPAHNEGENIQGVIENLRQHSPHTDILVVNDHSADDTSQIVRRLGVQQIYLPCNLGYRGALQIGCSWAIENGYERVVFFDGDGQHPASEIMPMLEKLDRGEGDLIIATRYSEGRPEGGNFLRFFGNQVFSYVATFLTGQRITDSTSGMKVIGPAVLPIIAEADFLDMHAEAIVYLGMQGFRIAEHPATFSERTAGTSMYGALSLVRYPLFMFTLILCSLMRAWLDRRKRKNS